MRELPSVPDDTSEETRNQIRVAMKALSPYDRLRRAGDLSSFVRKLVLAGIRDRNRSASPEKIQRLFAEATIGLELANKYFADPEGGE